MFSGIVEYLGSVKSCLNDNKQSRIIIQIENLEGVSIGTSVSVNGVCLTISKIDNNEYYFDVSEETFTKTNLSELKNGSEVNIELPLTMHKFISGHIVSGHIDGQFQISKFEKIDDSWSLALKMSDTLTRYIVIKGSVCVDGVSLTVNNIENNIMSLMIIPHTYENTIIKNYKVGNSVNIEVDYIAKHLEKLKND